MYENMSLQQPIATPTRLSASQPSQRRWGIAFAFYSALTNLTFAQGIWLIYLAGRGYSPFAIGLFEMGFHITKFVAEVPTGIFADLVGRRRSLIVACIIGAGAMLLYLTPTPPLIALSFCLQGLAFAFKGGADSALLWGLAERSGAADVAARYSQVFSRIFVLVLVAQFIGVASGGFLSSASLVLPFFCSGAATALGIVPLLVLPNSQPSRRGVGVIGATTLAPGIAELTPEGAPVRIERPHPLAHLGVGLRAAWHDPVLLGLILLSALTESTFTTVGFYTQLYFHGLGFSLVAVGLILACAIVPDAIGATVSPRVMRLLPRRRLLMLCIGAECLGLLAMSTERSVLGIVGFLLLFHVGDSLMYPAISTYLNQRSPEAQRATVLSLNSGLFSAVMIVLFPAFGLGLTHTSYGVAYRVTLVAFAGLAVAIYVGMRLLARSRRGV